MTARVTEFTLAEVEEWLRRFGVSYQERALRYALKGLGVEPITHRVNETSRKGRILFYDGLVPWVIASAALTHHGPLKDLAVPLASYREMAAARLGLDHPGVERLTNYMFVASPEYGLDVPQLVAVTSGDRSLLQIVPEDGETLLRVLVAYQRHRTEWEHTLDVTGGRPIDYSIVRHEFGGFVADLVVGSSAADGASTSGVGQFEDIMDPDEFFTQGE